MIAARHVRYRVGGTVILDDVTVTLAPGQVTAVLGPNGAGKSTLLKCLAGALAPTAGRVLLDGRPLAHYSLAALARKRAVLSQTNVVPFPFSVREIVEMGRTPARGRPAGGDAAVVQEALERVDAWHLRDRLVPTLSGGERQRVHLARVFAQIWDRDDGALLLDEPTAALDLKHQHRVLDLTRTLAEARRLAVCLVLHDLHLALRYADRGVVMKDGRVVACAAIREALTPDIVAGVFEVPAHVVFSERGPNAIPQPGG